MSEKTQSTKDLAAQLLTSEEIIKEVVGALAGSTRRDRQNASSVLAQAAKMNPEVLVPYTNDFIDALNRPEAQTRWESLDVLTELVPFDSRTCDKGIAGAETALFDEDNGICAPFCLAFSLRARGYNRKSFSESMAAFR